MINQKLDANMDKLKLFVIWLDGFMEACGPVLNEQQTSIVKDKLNGLFEHEAEPVPPIAVKLNPSIEDLGLIHGFKVIGPASIHGRGENGEYIDANMKDYFKRLREHSGLGTATMMTILGTLAGASNKSGPVLIGALFGFVFTGVIVWSIVLISNFKK